MISIKKESHRTPFNQNTTYGFGLTLYWEFMCWNAIIIIMVVVSTCFYATCAYVKAFVQDLKLEMINLDSHLVGRLRYDVRYSTELKKIIVDIIEFHVIIYK